MVKKRLVFFLVPLLLGGGIFSYAPQWGGEEGFNVQLATQKTTTGERKKRENQAPLKFQELVERLNYLKMYCVKNLQTKESCRLLEELRHWIVMREEEWKDGMLEWKWKNAMLEKEKRWQELVRKSSEWTRGSRSELEKQKPRKEWRRELIGNVSEQGKQKPREEWRKEKRKKKQGKMEWWMEELVEWLKNLCWKKELKRVPPIRVIVK